MNEQDLLLKIEGLEKVIQEKNADASRYQDQLKETKQELIDYNKPELTTKQMVAIEGAVQQVDNDYDFRIPNEMIKKRAVIILGKHRGQYIAVPVSSTKETHKKAHKIPEITGLHTRLLAKDFPETKKYKKETLRWAKSNLVMTIDGGRLRATKFPSLEDFCRQKFCLYQYKILRSPRPSPLPLHTCMC